ncbi:glycosyltransferase, partial [Neisseria gonorrhoeae]
EDSRRLAKQLLAQWRTTEMPPLEEEKVSVIVATHSGGNRIPRLLESLGAQTFPEHLLEVIVVENGSDDGTRALVGEFADDHREMTVRYLHSPQADVGAAHNLGLKQVSGAYVAFADDYDSLDENCILSMWLSAG